MTLRRAGFRFSKVLQHWEGLAPYTEAEALAVAHGGVARRIAASVPSGTTSARESAAAGLPAPRHSPHAPHRHEGSLVALLEIATIVLAYGAGSLADWVLHHLAGWNVRSADNMAFACLLYVPSSKRSPMDRAAAFEDWHCCALRHARSVTTFGSAQWLVQQGRAAPDDAWHWPDHRPRGQKPWPVRCATTARRICWTIAADPHRQGRGHHHPQPAHRRPQHAGDRPQGAENAAITWYARSCFRPLHVLDPFGGDRAAFRRLQSARPDRCPRARRGRGMPRSSPMPWSPIRRTRWLRPEPGTKNGQGPARRPHPHSSPPRKPPNGAASPRCARCSPCRPIASCNCSPACRTAQPPAAWNGARRRQPASGQGHDREASGVLSSAQRHTHFTSTCPRMTWR